MKKNGGKKSRDTIPLSKMNSQGTAQEPPIYTYLLNVFLQHYSFKKASS
jgi:hypothetical protein